ncbi:MAG TPA: hypothetical protein VGI95_17695 [Caulobacteraceae bacterium]
MRHEVRVALIGGTSHVGKSTTALALVERLGWDYVSTDKLARHPGRPWRTAPDVVPPHVTEHFGTLRTDELMASVLAHYQGMWPMVRELIIARAGDTTTERLVLEGSALWPEQVDELRLAGVRPVWLTASDALIETRMLRESGYASATEEGQRLIRSFLARTLAYNTAMMAAVRRLGLPFVEVTAVTSVADAVQACLRALAA